MSIEMVTGISMVVLMMFTILTKYISTVLLVRFRKQLLEAEAELRDARARLKAVENEQAVAEKNEKQFGSKKERLEKQLPQLKKELDKLRS